MKPLSMRTLESAESGGNLEVGANADGFHIVDASGGDSVRLDEGQATKLLSVLTEALGVPADAEDAYVRGFDRGFAEGAARAECEAWEVLGSHIGPRGPLDTTDDVCRLPADARETMTLAATVGVLTWRLARLAQACRLVVADARSDAATSNGPHLAAWAHDVVTDLEAALREAEAMP